MPLSYTVSESYFPKFRFVTRDPERASPDRRACVSVNLHTKLKVPTFIHSKDMTGPKNLKMDYVTLTAHYG